uniref:uncharacterized protein LOC118151598 n=1 Tax=Callithrix jacchus TaxID=9483 RepID=UPI0023DD1C3A|nr:uncharacterized protein LOC118151598 [Callithrix jacchus]XP_054108307.1 uncharacterized protein LOC118151598 [Callithrix jacchus]
MARARCGGGTISVQPVTAAVPPQVPSSPGSSPQPRAAAAQRCPCDPRSPASPQPCGSHSFFLPSLIQILPRPPTPRSPFDSEPALGRGESGRIPPTQGPELLRPVSLPETLHLQWFLGEHRAHAGRSPMCPRCPGRRLYFCLLPWTPTSPPPEVSSDGGGDRTHVADPRRSRGLGIRICLASGSPRTCSGAKSVEEAERAPSVSRVSFSLGRQPSGSGQGCRPPSVSPSAGFGPRGPQWLAPGYVQAAFG